MNFPTSQKSGAKRKKAQKDMPAGKKPAQVCLILGIFICHREAIITITPVPVHK